jgi:hypothetical protein
LFARMREQPLEPVQSFQCVHESFPPRAFPTPGSARSHSRRTGRAIPTYALLS